ncbi:putative phosphodiesterase [Variovorax boronicumulans]
MFSYILEHVKSKKVAGFSPDFLFITGDIANKGADKEYEIFWLEFVTPLQEIIGGDIKRLTFAVPGNHDVDRRENPAFSRDEMVGPKSQYFDSTPNGGKLRKIFEPRFAAYQQADLTACGVQIFGEKGAFFTGFDVRGIKVGIVGINTAWLTKGDDDEGRLTPGKTLLENALDAVKNEQIKFVLGHHPIDWFFKHEQKMLKSLLGLHGSIYLHGHLHDAWAEPTYGGGNMYLAIQAGSCFQAREGERWKNGLLWGEADVSTSEIKLQPMNWIADHQSWAIVSDAFPDNMKTGDW